MRDDSVMTPKQKVAFELLDCGLQMYFSKSYFAAIHLVGAAEELFSRHLLLWNAGKPSADEFRDTAAHFLGYEAHEIPEKLSQDLYRLIFHSRNRTKHVSGENDHDISFNPAHEAEVVLGRALDNFYAVAMVLGITPTRRMHRFDRARVS